MLDWKMPPRGATSSSEKLKLSIAMVVLSLLTAALILFTLQFDHVPKEGAVISTPSTPPESFSPSTDVISTPPESFNTSTDVISTPPESFNTSTDVISTPPESFNTSTDEISTPPESFNTSTDGCQTPECEVEWFPPRTWTQPSKYSPVASSHHGLQMYGTLAAQQAIWTHQHPSTCHDKKFLIYEAQGLGHGIGSMIHVAGVALLAALNTNRILVLAPQSNFSWVQGQFCEGLDTMDECYFEPLSSCTIYDAFGSDLEVTNENFQNFTEFTSLGPYNNSTERVLKTTVWHISGSSLRSDTPIMFHSMLERGNVSGGFYYWWRAQSSAYIVRPTLRTLRELDRRREGVFQGQSIEPGTISVHVRHEDKWKEAKLQPDSRFLRTTEALIAHQPDVLQRRIFLSTEDPNTVTFFAQLSNWTVQYTNVSRIEDPSVGPEDFARKIGWDEEFLNSLLSLQLALECDGFVGAIESNWNRLIDELRSTASSKFHRVYVDVVQGFQVHEFSW